MQTNTEQSTLATVLDRLEAVSLQLDSVMARQRKTDEFFEEMAPVFKAMMSEATQRLVVLEQKGYFAFGRELLAVAQKVVEGHSPDDVRQFGDAVVSILSTVRSLTQPEVLRIANQASQVLASADQAEPLGLVGMVRASRSDEVQKGMAVLMEVLRQVGRGTAALASAKNAKSGSPPEARLAVRRALGNERRLPSAMAQSTPARAPYAPPAQPGTAQVVIDKVAYTADGYLADPSMWSRSLAVTIAAAQGLELSEGQWQLIDFAREEYLHKKASPNIRRISQATGIPTRQIYTLFPKAPGRTIASIAGIPKPTGCL